MSYPRRVLKCGDKIPFEWITQKYGRAEFTFCLKYNRGKLKEVFITPQQQPNVKEWFVLPFHRDDFMAKSTIELDDPKIWLHFWCKEHKAPAFNLYVPKDSRFFYVGMSEDVTFAKKDF